MSKTSPWKRSADPSLELFRDAAAGPSSFNFSIPTAFSLIIVLSAYAFPDTIVFGISLHWADAISAATALLVFAAARLGIRNKSPKNVHGLRLWIFAGLGATAAPQIVLSCIAGRISLDYLSTSLVGILAYPLLVTILGVILAGRFNARARAQELKRKNAQLLLMRETLDDELASVQSEMRQLIQDRLSTVLSDITARLSSAGTETTRTASTELRVAIDEVVRPLSKELAFDQHSVFSNTEVFAQDDHYLEKYLATKVTRTSHLRASLSQIVTPLLTFFLALVFIVPALFSVYGIDSAIRGAIALTVLGILMSIVMRTNTGKKMPAILAIALLTFGSSVTSLAVSSALWGFASISEGPFAVSLSFTLITFGTSSFLYFAERREAALAESEETNNAIELLLSRMRQEIWVMRREQARLVHGKVQSQLLATLMRLNQIENPTSEDILRAKNDVISALNSFASEITEGVEPFTVQYSRIVDAWDGVCDVTLDADEELILLVDTDPVACMCIAEVIGEAVANAAKHSQAASVHVSLSKADDGYISVNISTTGELEHGTSNQSGYGSRILDELTASWDRSGADGLITLKALVALDPTRA